MIRYFEAFAGLGAFRSAFEKVGGFECVGWCEIDRYAQKAYRALWGVHFEPRGVHLLIIGHVVL